jgi:hypothetical protein
VTLKIHNFFLILKSKALKTHQATVMYEPLYIAEGYDYIY